MGQVLNFNCQLGLTLDSWVSFRIKEPLDYVYLDRSIKYKFGWGRIFNRPTIKKFQQIYATILPGKSLHKNKFSMGSWINYRLQNCIPIGYWVHYTWYGIFSKTNTITNTNWGANSNWPRI